MHVPRRRQPNANPEPSSIGTGLAGLYVPERPGLIETLRSRFRGYAWLWWYERSLPTVVSGNPTRRIPIRRRFGRRGTIRYRMAEITITTTDSLDGREVTDYLGVVSGEAVIGANVVSDIAAGIRDVVGGRSGSYERKIETGRREAINDIRAEAEELGADAVVGATFDYEEMAEGMLWVNLSGTAVRTRRR